MDQSVFLFSKNWLANWPEKYFSVCSGRLCGKAIKFIWIYSIGNESDTFITLYHGGLRTSFFALSMSCLLNFCVIQLKIKKINLSPKQQWNPLLNEGIMSCIAVKQARQQSCMQQLCRWGDRYWFTLQLTACKASGSVNGGINLSACCRFNWEHDRLKLWHSNKKKKTF